MKELAVAAIGVYQRYLSPYKGFTCAYRRYTGRAGCSALGLRAIRRLGLVRGLQVLRQRMVLCGIAHRRLVPGVRPPRYQRGDCDVGGCDGPGDGACDGVGGKGVSRWCDLGSACDVGSCDRSRKNDPDRKARERRVYLPPGPGAASPPPRT